MIEMKKVMFSLESLIKTESTSIKMVRKLIVEGISLIQKVMLLIITMVKKCSKRVILMKRVKFLLRSTLKNIILILMKLEATLTMIRMEILLSKRMPKENLLTNEDLASAPEDIWLTETVTSSIIVDERNLTSLMLRTREIFLSSSTTVAEDLMLQILLVKWIKMLTDK
jgi:hypothetical protein